LWLLQHFWLGLSKESALYLDQATGGLFSHKDTTEGREILNHFLEISSYADNLSKHLNGIIKIAETSIAEPEPIDSSAEPSLEPSVNPQLLEDEEIQPSVLPFELEEDIFEDFRNTYNCIERCLLTLTRN